jgi:chromosomal replication initiator protein
VRMHLQAKIENRPLDQSYLSREGVCQEPRKETISLEEIVVLVEHNYGICRTELMSKSRKGNTNWARQVAMYLARLHTLHPLEQIGKAFGRDHATVIHAFGKVAEIMEQQPTRRFEVEFLRQKLQGRSARPNGNPV